MFLSFRMLISRSIRHNVIWWVDFSLFLDYTRKEALNVGLLSMYLASNPSDQKPRKILSISSFSVRVLRYRH
jgi:hypothetical protein